MTSFHQQKNKMTICSSSLLPLGFRFKPTDKELISDYLWKKVNGLQLPSNAVVEKNVQELEPWLLMDHTKCSEFSEGYYFVRREKKFAKANGKTPKRRLAGGWWKATQGDKPIPGQPLGYVKTLKFQTHKDGNNPICNKCSKSDWIMHEFRLDSDTFQEWVICRIKRKQNKRAEMETATSSTRQSIELSLSEQELQRIGDESEADSSYEQQHEPLFSVQEIQQKSMVAMQQKMQEFRDLLL